MTTRVRLGARCVAALPVLCRSFVVVVMIATGCCWPPRGIAAERQATAVGSRAEADPLARFFADCPSKPPIRVHHDQSPWDLHAIAYSASNVMELEIIRLADWLIDLPAPGVEFRPIERSVEGIRGAYHRIATNRPMQRFGELVDALQLRQLSLGDAAVTHSVTSGHVNPGSGTLVRINKLIDWSQHIVGDLNEAAGWCVRRPGGLVRWPLPGRAVDRLQDGVVWVFHGVSVVVAEVMDQGISGLERTTGAVVNIARPSAHRRTTVFLRMPIEVYRAHERWILAHRGRIYVGTPEELAELSHAALFHPHHRPVPGRAWWSLARFSTEPPSVVMVTDRWTFASAPSSLADYVVPGAWAFAEHPSVEDKN